MGGTPQGFQALLVSAWGPWEAFMPIAGPGAMQSIALHRGTANLPMRNSDPKGDPQGKSHVHRGPFSLV